MISSSQVAQFRAQAARGIPLGDPHWSPATGVPWEIEKANRLRARGDQLGARQALATPKAQRFTRMVPAGRSSFLGGATLGGVIGGIGGIIGGPIGGVLGGIGDMFNKPNPPGPPGLPAPPRTPEPGWGGRIRRALPGGRSGYDYDPIEASGFAPLVEPEVVERHKAPPGYVIVEYPRGSGQKVAMLRVLATKYGFWKSRPKPPISGWDAKAIRRAASAKKRVKKLASSVGFTTKEKGRGGGTTRSRGKKC